MTVPEGNQPVVVSDRNGTTIPAAAAVPAQPGT